MKYEKEIGEIRDIIENARHGVFFGGAGVSTASGIPDFRSSKGLYSDPADGAEYCLSRECLLSEPKRFFEFYREKMVYPNAQPNAAHHALARLEERGKIKAVITQNIDGLHQKAGSKSVIELHGTVSGAFCDRCGRAFSPAIIDEGESIPTCPVCGGTVRPDVTLYGEALPVGAFSAAKEHISRADVLIVGGSSLTVQPAASLVSLFSGEHLIIINYSETPYDGLCEYVIRDSLTDVLAKLAEC
ncbi:MAG: NAD-dependent protein deacylase [Clostridia bacterium]|nr:NAD-dependent protein deacylase [Clostridia bacterium]